MESDVLQLSDPPTALGLSRIATVIEHAGLLIGRNNEYDATSDRLHWLLGAVIALCVFAKQSVHHYYYLRLLPVFTCCVFLCMRDLKDKAVRLK